MKPTDPKQCLTDLYQEQVLLAYSMASGGKPLLMMTSTALKDWMRMNRAMYQLAINSIDREAGLSRDIQAVMEATRTFKKSSAEDPLTARNRKMANTWAK